MAFNLQSFALDTFLQNNGNPNKWTYKSSVDAKSVIATTGYFNQVKDRLTVGDIVTIFDSAGTVTTTYVRLNDGTNVDVTDGTTQPSTNTN